MVDYFKRHFGFRFSIAAIIIIITERIIYFIPLAALPFEIGIMALISYLIAALVKIPTLKKPIRKWLIIEFCFWIAISITIFIQILIFNIL